MTREEKIEELEKRMKEFQENMQKEIDELKKDEQEWKPEKNKEYWFYDKDLEDIRVERWLNHTIDNIRLKNRVAFKTKQEAQRYADYQKAKQEYSHEFTKEDWKDDKVCKYYIYYNEQSKIAYERVCKDMSKTYFKTQEQAQKFINKYRAEILEYEFGIKE